MSTSVCKSILLSVSVSLLFSPVRLCYTLHDATLMLAMTPCRRAETGSRCAPSLPEPFVSGRISQCADVLTALPVQPRGRFSSSSCPSPRPPSMAGRLLLILPLGPHDGPDGRGREDNRGENPCPRSTLCQHFYTSAISNCGACSTGLGTIWIAARTGSIERRDALLNLEIIHRVLAVRRAQPRPPGF